MWFLSLFACDPSARIEDIDLDAGEDEEFEANCQAVIELQGAVTASLTDPDGCSGTGWGDEKGGTLSQGDTVFQVLIHGYEPVGEGPISAAPSTVNVIDSTSNIWWSNTEECWFSGASAIGDTYDGLYLEGGIACGGPLVSEADGSITLLSATVSGLGPVPR